MQANHSMAARLAKGATHTVCENRTPGVFQSGASSGGVGETGDSKITYHGMSAAKKFMLRRVGQHLSNPTCDNFMRMAVIEFAF